MASYPAPDDRRSNIFNETDYLTTPSELASIGEENKYVKIGGNFMSGALSTPYYLYPGTNNYFFVFINVLIIVYYYLIRFMQ
jgi:hypothetical protein